MALQKRFYYTWEEDETQELQEDDSVEFPGPDAYSRGSSTPGQPDEVLTTDVTYKQWRSNLKKHFFTREKVIHNRQSSAWSKKDLLIVICVQSVWQIEKKCDLDELPFPVKFKYGIREKFVFQTAKLHCQN